ncbi:MAG: hypothetical protein ACLFSQ_07785 [Candidatus Zixiibacteriota bacterium]
MKVYDYTQIDLSDKYEKLFSKYEENANEPIEDLQSEKETLTYQNDALSYIKNEMRSLKLDYIGSKRKAIYGSLEQNKIDDIKLRYENIKTNLKALGETDRRYQTMHNNFKRLDPADTLSMYKGSSDVLTQKQKNSKLMQRDRITQELDKIYLKTKTSLRTVSRKKSSLNTKIEKESFDAQKEKFNFKVSLANLESFEKSAENILRSFYSSFDMKV